MKVSTKTRYGLRIMLQLAEALADGNTVKGKDIVGTQEITVPYMEQIMIKLRQAGWVLTERGCQGGYKLNAAPESITVLDLMELFEGPLKLVNCCDKNKRCTRLDKCASASAWRLLAESFRSEAHKMNLAEIIKLNAEAKEDLK